uniref:Putative conserved secreted protein n=1 Tax=Nyssomyia neivai TaxID=330878 RepID=A0A1L8DPX2_9DIPT
MRKISLLFFAFTVIVLYVDANPEQTREKRSLFGDLEKFGKAFSDIQLDLSFLHFPKFNFPKFKVDDHPDFDSDSKSPNANKSEINKPDESANVKPVEKEDNKDAQKKEEEAVTTTTTTTEKPKSNLTNLTNSTKEANTD